MSFIKFPDVWSWVYILLLFLFKEIDAKQCHYVFDSGEEKYFRCSVYEYCCGTLCCRSRAITFYQMWYFWLMIFLTILLCSGGGWWYRFRNQGPFLSPALPAHIISPGPITVQGNQRDIGRRQDQTHIPIPPQVISAPQYVPPPPYYGPPPTYEVAVNQRR